MDESLTILELDDFSYDEKIKTLSFTEYAYVRIAQEAIEKEWSKATVKAYKYMAKRIGDDLLHFFSIDKWWMVNEEVGELYLEKLSEVDSFRYKTLKKMATVFYLVTDEELPIRQLKEESEQPISELSSKEFEQVYPERYRKYKPLIDFVRAFGVADKYFRVSKKKLSYDFYDGTLPNLHGFNLIHEKSSKKLAVELFYQGKYCYLPVLKEYEESMWQQWKNQSHVVEDGYSEKSVENRTISLIERAKGFKFEEPLIIDHMIRNSTWANLTTHRIYYVIEKLREYQREHKELIENLLEKGNVTGHSRLKLVVDKKSKTSQVINRVEKTIIEQPDEFVVQLLSQSDGYYLVSDIAKIAQSVDIVLFENIAKYFKLFG
uniref:hypothetical protein n=1 Tax=Streptococcus pluranimalium TaxID=82348 RepID=UPI003F694D25